MIEDPNGVRDEKFNDMHPYIETAEELFQYYTSMPLDDENHVGIIKDLTRTDPGNKDWKVDQKTG
jgi:hypothetical protein